MKIVFFGTPDFAVPSLEALINTGFDVAAVVTAPDKPAGRGHKLQQSAVKQFAVAHGIECLQPTNLKSEEFQNELRALDADLFVVIAFRMLPESVWSMPRLGTFNLHASLLPKYRGAAPINHAIINGETKTGVTTFLLDREIDTGGILFREETEIGPDENVESLHDRLMAIGAPLVVKTAKALFEGTAVPTPQGSADGEPQAPKIFKDFCRINWNASAEKISRHVRGLSPYPAAWTTLKLEDGKALDTKVFDVKIKELTGAHANPGQITVDDKKLLVACGEGIVEIISLQPAGKKRMTAEAFLAGYKPVEMEM